MEKKLNSTKINRKKIALGLALCLFAPFSIYFIASCGSDTQLNTGTTPPPPAEPEPPISPPDKPNPPSSVLITKDQITFENAFQSPPSLYVDKTNNQLLLDNASLIKTTYSKTDFTKITTSKLAFDDATGNLAFELSYESKGVPVTTTFIYDEFKPILKERKVGVQYWKDDFINSKLNAYDYANKTYNTPEEVNAFFKILNDNNKGSIYVGYDLLGSSFELPTQNYSIKKIVTGKPVFIRASSNLSLDLTHSIDIITFSKKENENIVKTIFSPNSVSETSFSVSFPNLAQYVMNNLTVNTDASSPELIRIKSKYPSYYYASYAQPLLGIGSDPLGFIPEADLITEIIKNGGLFNYKTELTIDGEKVPFTIICQEGGVGVSKADDLTGELDLTVFIQQESNDISKPSSSHNTYKFSGFKKLASSSDLFLQSGQTNKTDKFSIAYSVDTNIADVVGALVKVHDIKLQEFIKASSDNEVVILPDELETIAPRLGAQVNDLTHIFFGNDRNPLEKKVPTSEQGTSAFYVFTPFYIDTVSKEFTKLSYNKTTSKYTIYYSMTVGISVFGVNTQEFAFELKV